MSASMDKKRGFTMLPRWAKTVLRLVPDHSTFSEATWTENDMSVSSHSMPSTSKKRMRLG